MTRSIHAVLFAIFLVLLAIGFNLTSSGMGFVVTLILALALVIGFGSFFVK